MTTVNQHKRKMIEIDRKRVPLRKLFHGKEIRDAAKALEDFRLNLNEAEFLYGGKIKIVMDSYGECVAVVSRPETDKELEARIEKARLAEVAKKEREVKRKQQEEERKIRQLEDQKKRTLEHVKNLAQSNGITKDELKALVESLT